MHIHYKDILERIQEEPTWWDNNGCPRYGEFNPMLAPNVYAIEVLLLLISCQNCRKRFKVEMHFDMLDQFNLIKDPIVKVPTLKDCIEAKERIHYGDPPFHNCVGDSMNCYDLKVLEFWRSGDMKTEPRFVRVPELEVELEGETEDNGV